MPGGDTLIVEYGTFAKKSTNQINTFTEIEEILPMIGEITGNNKSVLNITKPK